jgi:soluble lytic murein transglycosylase
VRNPPVTGDGALAWLSAPTRAGAPAVPADAIARAWIDLDFTPAAEERFYAAFRKVLTSADNNARLDRLIWERRTDAASRMLRRVDSAQAALATARLTLISSKGNVDGAVARVPAALRDAPELWYERLKWRRKAGLDDAARLVLLDPPAAMAALPQWPQGDLWAQEGQILARRALSDGHVSDAYRLAASHKLDAGVEFAESEFLAGWIGLSLLRDTKTALGHFSRLYDNVRFPISRARGAFWAGEAAAAPGATEQARDWYQRASKFPTTYYGQAALKALGEPLPKVRIDAAAAPAAREAFERRDIVAVVRQLGMIDRPEILRSFLLRLMYASEDADEMMLVAELALSVGQPLEGLRAAKRAYREDGALSPFAYPMVALPKLPSVAATTDPALLLALIRQESGFDRQATSGAGARGMMQLLPGTAADVARKLGMDYSMPRLTEDPAYNIQLGSAYFADLLDRFGGEPALALAGYNAGPRNVHRWLATNGTPGQGGLSLNDWIESIPYAETRNYVQRVLEAVPVYRQLLNDPARPTVTVPEL